MRTTGLMGEVVGMAASVCKEHDTTPRGVYEKHLDELKALMGPRDAVQAGPTRAAGGIAIGIAEDSTRTSSAGAKYRIDSMPAELRKMTCVTVARGGSGSVGAGYKFRISAPSHIYIAVHDRGSFRPPAEWERTDMKIRWLKTHTDTVYVKQCPAGVVEVPGHTGRDGAHYGLPHMTSVAGDVRVTPAD